MLFDFSASLIPLEARAEVSSMCMRNGDSLRAPRNSMRGMLQLLQKSRSPRLRCLLGSRFPRMSLTRLPIVYIYIWDIKCFFAFYCFRAHSEISNACTCSQCEGIDRLKLGSRDSPINPQVAWTGRRVSEMGRSRPVIRIVSFTTLVTPLLQHADRS